MKSLSVSFESVQINPEYGNGLSLRGDNAVVFIEKKTIFLHQSKYSFKAAHIQSVDTSTSDHAGVHTITFVAAKKDETKITCTGPTDEKHYQKLVDKLQAWAHKNNPQETDVAPSTSRKPRSSLAGRRSRVFGKQTKRRKMPNILSYNWDDEDQQEDDSPASPTHEETAHAVPVSEKKADEEADDEEASTNNNNNNQEDGDATLMGPSDSDDEEEDRIIVPVKTQTHKKAPKRRLVVEDSDDEDAPLTTPNPSIKRMVSPSLTVPASKTRDKTEKESINNDSQSVKAGVKSILSVDSEKGKNDSDQAESQKTTKSEDDDSEESSMISKDPRPKSQPSIASFFAGRSQKTKKAAPAAPRLASPPRKHKPLLATPQRRVVKKVRNNDFPDDDAWLAKSAATVSPKKQREPSLLGNADLKSPPRPIPKVEEDPIEEFDSPREDPVEDPLDALDRVPHLPPSRLALSQKRKRTFARNGQFSPRFTPPRTTSKNLFGNRASLPLSPEEKPVRRHRGLRNLGNTCYMNACIQLVAAWCKERLAGWDKRIGAAEPLTHSLVSVSESLLADIPKDIVRSSDLILNPTAIKHAMDEKTDKFRGFEQRDAHEFLSDMIDHVHEELSSHEKKLGSSEVQAVLPTDDFRLTVQVNLECMSCQYTRTKEEMYRHLSIDIPDSKADSNFVAQLPQSLDQFFEPEVREIRCEKCSSGTHAKQSMKITSQPRMLLLHLKRFVFVEKPISPPVGENEENAHPNSPSARKRAAHMEYVFQKKKTPVDLQPQLSLQPYCSLGDDKKMGAEAMSEAKYELDGVVYHIGSRAESGHYTANALRLKLHLDEEETTADASTPSEDVAKAATNESSDERKAGPALTDRSGNPLQWTAFDDGNSCPLKRSPQTRQRQETAYMLLYKRNTSSMQFLM